MPRRRRPLSVTALIVAAAIAAPILAATASLAQTPPPDSSIDDLMRPSLHGYRKKPPRFRRAQEPAPLDQQAPPSKKFTAPSRVGAIPVYGSPPGFGAGDTGFDSTNARRRKALTQAAPPPSSATTTPETTFTPVPTFTAPPPPKKPAPPKPPAPEVHPLKAANRPGAVLPLPPEPLPVSNPPPEVHPFPAASRPGATLPVPPEEFFQPSVSTPPPGLPLPNTMPLGTVPQRPLPLGEGEPYSAVGIRGGSFMFFPAVELSSAYDRNPLHVPGGQSSPYFVVAPELEARSDWSRHSLTATIVGSYTEYAGSLVPSLNRPYLNSTIDGRIDVLRETQILLESRFIVATDNPGSPNLQAGLARLPINTTVGGTLGIAQEFSRLQITLKGTVDRSTYQNSVLTNGEVSSNDDRNFDQYGAIARVGYELGPGLKPFMEVSEDERIHDQEFDRSGLRRDSTGSSAKFGGDIDLFGTLTGEVAFGYLERIYQDPTLPNIAGTIADGSLIWKATPLTTAKLTAVSSVSESVVAGTSGAFSRDFNLQVDHAFRRWLIGTLKAGYGRDDYVGSIRLDNRYFVSIGMIYMMTRSLQLKTEARQDWLVSTESGASYEATSFLLGLRLQR